MYYVKCLFGFCLVPESDESADNFPYESSDDKEDEESYKISIYSRDVWTCSCYFACYIAALRFVDFQELVAFYSYKRPFQIFLFRFSDSSCDFLIRLSSIQASSWRWRSSSISWVLLISSLWRNKYSNPFLALFIIRKAAEACVWLFFRVRLKSQFTIFFSYYTLLNTYSNKNMIMQNFTIQILIVFNNLLNKLFIMFFSEDCPTGSA